MFTWHFRSSHAVLLQSPVRSPPLELGWLWGDAHTPLPSDIPKERNRKEINPVIERAIQHFHVKKPLDHRISPSNNPWTFGWCEQSPHLVETIFGQHSPLPSASVVNFHVPIWCHQYIFTIFLEKIRSPHSHRSNSTPNGLIISFKVQFFNIWRSLLLYDVTRVIFT